MISAIQAISYTISAMYHTRSMPDEAREAVDGLSRFVRRRAIALWTTQAREFKHAGRLVWRLASADPTKTRNENEAAHLAKARELL